MGESSDPPRVLGLVPARGGSKSIPRKNIKLLRGKPLLAYTADAARGAARITRAVLSTDDEEIAEVGRSVGLEVPFLRPPELARDDTPTLPVVHHALEQLEHAGERFDAVCLLQPTDPLRTSALIDRAVQALASSAADSVISVCRVPHAYNPHWVYFRTANGDLKLATGDVEPIARRQDLPPAFHRSGSVYVTRTAVLMRGSLYGDRTVGVEMDPAETVNLDTPEDWLLAEKLLESRA